MHRHEGTGSLIFVYNQSEDSVYFVTNSKGTKAWINGLSLPQSGNATIIQEDAGADIIRIGNKFHLEMYDTHSPGLRIKAIFSLEQAEAIIAALQAR